MLKLLAVAVAILAAALLAGCGGSATTSGTGTPTSAATKKPGGNPAGYDACELVTTAKATQVVGTDVVALSGAGGGAAGGASSCIYASSSTGASVSVTVIQVPNNAGQAAITQALLSKGGLVTLSGIGDAAGEAKEANSVTIAFTKGQAFVVIAASSSSASGATMAPRLESLARSIAGQL